MGYRYDQLNMTSTFATDFFLGNFYTTTIADDSLITDALILTASALIILCRTKDSLAEKAITVWVIGAIIDCLRIGHLARRINKNLIGRSESNCEFVKIALNSIIFLKSHCSSILGCY